MKILICKLKDCADIVTQHNIEGEQFLAITDDELLRMNIKSIAVRRM